MKIEFATAEDLPAMAELLAELFTLEAEFQPDREKQLAGLKLILDNPALGRLFVLRDAAQLDAPAIFDGARREPAGMANALITISTAEGGRVLLLEDVVLHRAYRGRGLGKKLIEYVLAWAAGEGITRVTLLADRGNTEALNFYARLDFQPSTMSVLRKSLSG